LKTISKILMMFLFLGGMTAFQSCSDDDPPPPPPPVLSTEANILTFTFAEQTGPAIINATAATVEIEVEGGTDLTSLSPDFTVSEGASASPVSGTEGDYSSNVTITVTAEDGTTTKGWTVNVSEAGVVSEETDILTFTLPEQTGDAVINADTHTIGIEVAKWTNLTSLTPTFTLSAGATSDPASETEGDYSTEVTITVTAEDGTTIQDWIVNVSEAPSSDTEILLFGLAEQTSLAAIDRTTHTVDIEVVNGTDLTNLTPTFMLSIGASSEPVSETAGNYSSAVTITVTAEDGITTQDWTVNVTEATAGVSDKTDILSFEMPEQITDPTIDGNNHKVTVTVPVGTNTSILTPTFTLSPGATSVPVSGIASDYSEEFTITVTAEDGTTVQDWTVEVIAVDDLNSLFCNENLCTNDPGLQQECQDFLLVCLATQSQFDYDECLITAISLCSD
jgi:hypothetical protein